jgi:Rod binding domain-containing protein
MEANFLKEMMRNMRKTVPENPDLANSRGYQVFRGMLDDHYAETAAKAQGIGLAELIVKQVMQMQESARKQAPPPVRELNRSDVIGK